MVLNRVWTINKDKDYIKLVSFKTHKYRHTISTSGHYHFVCGLPTDLNVHRSFREDQDSRALRHMINRAASEKSKYILKTKIHVFTKYNEILKEKRQISLKGEKVDGRIHWHFTVKESDVEHDVELHFRIMSMGIFKRLRVHAALYKDQTPEENERMLRRAYLNYIFAPDKVEHHNIFSIEIDEIISQSDVNLTVGQDTVGSQYSKHLVSQDDMGSILNAEIFDQAEFGDDSRRSQINVSDTTSFKEYVREKTLPALQKSLLDSMKSKYPIVRYHLVENPYKDAFHESEKESTFLTDIQIQLLNYEIVPKKKQSFVWYQRYNSKIFGHNINEIIRLCSTSPEPQMVVILDSNNYIFGGYLCHGLYLKNRYNKEAATNFSSIYHTAFCLSNYDIPRGYSTVGDESLSAVFTFFDTRQELHNYNYKVTEGRAPNTMYRLVNDRKGIAMGGPKFAFLIDNSVQHGSCDASETYGNGLLASGETFDIQALEIWGLQKSNRKR